MGIAKSIIILLNFLFILLLQVSCTNHKSNENSKTDKVKPYPHVINIEEGFNNVSKFKLSDIADSIKYVVLSKDKHEIIGDFYKIQLTDNNIYLHNGNSQLIMRFDMNGKYLNSYGNIGRGPNEYLPGSSYTTTPDDNKIHVFGSSTMKNYLTFDLDGNYVKTGDFPIPRTLYDFRSMSDSVFLCTFYFVGAFMMNSNYDDINWSFGLFDLNGNPIDVIDHPLKDMNLSEAEKRNVATSTPTITYFDNRAVIIPQSDTIYEIDSNSIFKGFIVDWGNVPHKESNEELFFRQTGSSNKVSIWTVLLETYDKLYFRVFRSHETYIFEYDKITGSTKSMLEDPNNLGFINDLDGGANYFPYYNNRSGNIWVIEDDAYSFKEKNSSETLASTTAKYPEMKESLRTFSNNLKQDDNPVLKIVYLKKYPKQ